MFQAKDLSETQIATIRGWVENGAQLADLQKLLKEEFDLTVTYMDMRFAALDLGLEFKKEEEAEEPQEIEAPLQPQDGVTLTVDQITVPGAYVSGRVTFSDGEQGVWLIDQMGRPSLDPDTAGYRPTQDDLVEFQMKLREALEEGQGMGY